MSPRNKIIIIPVFVFLLSIVFILFSYDKKLNEARKQTAISDQKLHDLVQLYGLSYEMNERFVDCYQIANKCLEDNTLNIMIDGHPSWKNEYYTILED